MKFLEIVIKTKKHGVTEMTKKWKNCIATLAHILINSVRSRSFVSHILLGLSSLIHRKYASKKLIDCLANLGLCGSYSETILFESSIVKDPEIFKIADDSFIQCIYDNADHTTKTIDGLNTFHAMRNIMVVAPSSAVTTEKSIIRLNKVPSVKEIATDFGFLEIKNFIKDTNARLQNVLIKKLDIDANENNIDSLDMHWMVSKTHDPKGTKGWLSFMETFIRACSV